MRWPYNARVDAVHAWGAVAAGIAIVGIIVGALAVIHGNEPHFRWWWPSNWLIVPGGIVVIGLIMVVVPLRRHDSQSEEEVETPPEPPRIPQPFEQNITAESGSTAQGAAFGNVINYAEQPGNRPTAPAATEPRDRHDDQSEEGVVRPPEPPRLPQSFEQNITAKSGSTAQGAAFGNVINYAKQPGNGPTAPPATESKDKQP
jgi:hypothetical protein